VLKKAQVSAEARQLSEEAIQDHLKAVYQKYYKVKGSARELCQTALESLAEAIASAGNLSQESALKALQEREKQRDTARKLSYLRGKLKADSTTMVSTVDEAGNRVEITNQQDMERAILNNNHQKFLQSSHTPFYTSPLKEEFGFKGLTSPSQAALAGIYDSNYDIDSRILDVIAQWQMPDAV
jgi:hypothetical protein